MRNLRQGLQGGKSVTHPPLEIIRFKLGPLQTNGYLIGDKETGKAWIIDPAAESKRIEELLSNRKWTLDRILLTHAHFDHIGGVNSIRKRHGADLYVHREDAPLLADADLNFSVFTGIPCTVPEPYFDLEESENLTLGATTFQVLHTPGHTDGSVSFYTAGHVFVGDVLFRGSVGRTDFPGASFDKLLQSIQEKLLGLPDETVVHPGHGPETTIRRERTENVFLGGNRSYI